MTEIVQAHELRRRFGTGEAAVDALNSLNTGPASALISTKSRLYRALM